MKPLASMIGKGLLGAAVGVMAFGTASLVQAQELQTVNFISPNDSSCSPYPQYTAQQFGFWSKEGIKVNLLTSDTEVTFVAFLQNGDADIVTLDPAQVLQAVDNNLPIKVVYEAYQHTPEAIVVVADSPIQGLADLKDVTIGMASDRDQLTVVMAMDSIGATVEGNNIATVVVGNSGPVMAKALRDGTIQAFVGSTGDRAGIEAAGVQIRNITPAEVSRNPGNSFVAWGPTIDEKRPLIEKFLRGWAMAQHAGVIDTKLSASACSVHIPEQFENVENGMRMTNNAVYINQLRRTKEFGELQPEIWTGIQPSYLKQNEITKLMDPATFLDSSFIGPANDFTTDDVKAGMNAWKEANPEKVID